MHLFFDRMAQLSFPAFIDDENRFGAIGNEGREGLLFEKNFPNNWQLELYASGQVACKILTSPFESAVERLLQWLNDPEKAEIFRENKVYWPSCSVAIGEETDQVIQFLDTAYQQGFKSFLYYQDSFGASSDDGREGLLIWRGQRGWYVDLFDSDERVGYGYAKPFERGAEMVLRWLKCREIAEGLQRPDSEA
jgi:hypothetical protein